MSLIILLMQCNAHAPKGQAVANRGEKRENGGCREKKTLFLAFNHFLELPQAKA